MGIIFSIILYFFIFLTILFLYRKDHIGKNINTILNYFLLIIIVLVSSYFILNLKHDNDIELDVFDSDYYNSSIDGVVEDIINGIILLDYENNSFQFREIVDDNIIISFFPPSECFSCLENLKNIESLEFSNIKDVKLVAFDTNFSEIHYFLRNFNINNYDSIYILKSDIDDAQSNYLYNYTPNVVFVNSSLEVIADFTAPKDPNNFYSFEEIIRKNEKLIMSRK